MNFEIYFEKLFNFYNVSTIKELSEKIKIGASTISAWNQRKSITALKKACRELDIYNEIFGDLEKNISPVKIKSFTTDIQNTLNIIDTMIKNNGELKNKFHNILKDFVKENL